MSPASIRTSPPASFGVENTEKGMRPAVGEEANDEFQFGSGDEVRVDAYGSLLVARNGYSIHMNLDSTVLFSLALRHRDLALVLDMTVDVGLPLDVNRFGADAQRIYTADNAGGSSDLSEAFSMELLQRTIGARLQKTEMELEYFTGDGTASKITDYSISLEGVVVGVSVTRACRGFPVIPEAFTVEEAVRLLTKKLKGVQESTRSVSNTSWEKQLLHVFVPDSHVLARVRDAYDLIANSLTENTIVLLSLCSGKQAGPIFKRDSTATGPVKKRQRTCLGMKSEEHLQNLAKSVPRA